jgi:molybdate transport system ATP-binding protein
MKESLPEISAAFKGRLGKFAIDVAFRAPLHGITALFGPSASGKTTVLRCIAGLNHLDGRLAVGGEVWQDDHAFLLPHDRPIGYVFQEASLFSHLSVRQNLLYGYQRALKHGASDTIRFDDVIALMGISDLLDRGIGPLSGGERQRVAIGRALLSQPRLLLMDEPLSSLDRQNKDEILPYFERLHEALSIPILYVSHDISEIERLADFLVLLEQGRVVASGPVGDVLADARLPIAMTPEAAVIVEAVVKGFDTEYDLTRMEINGEGLFIPGYISQAGGTRRIRIAAHDVSLSRDVPSQTSILNVLPVRVADIHRVDSSQVNVVLSIGHREGTTKLLARISRRALVTLGLASGQHIYAQVKAVSLIAAGLTWCSADELKLKKGE